MIAPWVLIIVALIASATPNRIPYPMEDNKEMMMMAAATEQFDSWLNMLQKISRPQWEKSAYQVDSQLTDLEPSASALKPTVEDINGHLCNNNQNVDLNAPVVAENNILDSLSVVDKREHPSELHDRDICLHSYGSLDLGHRYYPRYLQYAICNKHVPDNLKRHIKCREIHYNIEVLTRRKESDPEGHSILPEALKDWRLAKTTVNVGCRCVIINGAA